MKTETDALLIPVTGDLELIVVQAHTDSLVWATGLLAEHGGSNKEIVIILRNEGRRTATALFTHQPDGQVNPRARAAVAHLNGGAQVIFRGPVLLAGLTRDSADEIEKLIGTM